jgi:glycosyltransferase involved in cell wall biosynthesis
MKLIIQIPCYNEQEQLGETFADLPRTLKGIDEIEVLIIDDGSSDATYDKALALGAHYIIRFPKNRGLATAYQAGLDACMRLGADIVVNTDADNQYRGADIARLIEPILAQQADMVIGDRQTDTIEHFSLLKRFLQKWGSRIVRRASGTEVVDSTSGFRAINNRAMSYLFVHNKFTYTLETIIQAGSLGLTITNIKIRTNPDKRKSRLASSITDYLRRNGPVIFRSYTMYWPVQTFGYIALALFTLGVILVGRFLFYFIQNPNYSGHIQSLQLGVGATVMAFIFGLIALLGDLLASNRRLSQEILSRLRKVEATIVYKNAPLEKGVSTPFNEVYKTGADAWRSSGVHR